MISINANVIHSLLEEPRKYEEYYKFYVATYLRLAPYMVGFLAAYVTKIFKDRMIKFTLVSQNFEIIEI